MLDNQGFDLWADTYDDSVKQAERENEYPFAGYTGVMNAVYAAVMCCTPAKVLDVGFGTALLSGKLYEAGCDISGIDFSAEMLAAARQKMPNAHLLQWDFTRGVPPALSAERFDFIVSTYALHHLEGDAQATFIRALCSLLKPEGRLLIGDVCFKTDDALAACREQSGKYWDDEENYIVLSALQPELPEYAASFHAFSFCAGLIEIRRKA